MPENEDTPINCNFMKVFLRSYLRKMDEDFVAFSKEDEENDNAPALLTETAAPWLIFSEGYDRFAPPLIRFHNEILAFCEYIAPSNNELNRRDIVVAEITEIVRSLWPKCTVNVFGSQMTRILTPTSDLDIAVLEVPKGPSFDMQSTLVSLAEKFTETGLFSYCEAIVNAKVPIVKLDHIASGISIDICINNDSGLKTGKFVRKLVRDFPPLRPLTIVLKVFLAQRRLNETYGGGLGSFILCSMIASFLQMKQMNARYVGVNANWNLATLLLEFFTLYGCSFNYYQTGISITNGGSYFPKRKRKANEAFTARPNLLYIENPDSPDLDMGRNSFQMMKIRRAFEHASQLMTSSLGQVNVASYLSFVIRPDDPDLADRPGPELNDSRSNKAALK